MGRSRRWNKPCRLGMIRLARRRLRLGRGVKSLRLRQGTYSVWQRGSRSCDTPTSRRRLRLLVVRGDRRRVRLREAQS